MIKWNFWFPPADECYRTEYFLPNDDVSDYLHTGFFLCNNRAPLTDALCGAFAGYFELRRRLNDSVGPTPANFFSPARFKLKDTG